MDNSVDSANSLSHIEDGTKKIFKGSEQVLRQLVRQLSERGDKLIDKNLAVLYTCFAVSIIFLLTALLLVFAVLNILVVKFGFEYWESALITCGLLSVVVFAGFLTYKTSLLFVKKKSRVIVPSLRDGLVCNKIEEGLKDVTKGLGNFFSLRGVVTRNPQASLIAAGAVGAFVAQILLSSNSNAHHSVGVNLTGLSNKKSAIDKSSNNKERSPSLVDTIISIALPFVISTLQKKLSFEIEDFLRPDTLINHKSDRAVPSV